MTFVLRFRNVNIQTENILTAPNIPEQKNPPVLVATPHPCNFILNKLLGVIIPDHNAQPKLKTRSGFVRNSVSLCPSLYIYHDGFRIDELIKYFTKIIAPFTYERIVQVPNI